MWGRGCLSGRIVRTEGKRAGVGFSDVKKLMKKR